ncbi:DUF6177 family protein [Actinomadura syzygii]|uniref:Uncharacterized protein n=1 Tax=Actinomadura syzygii TaxID=1427538 RepID=A0A5D0UMU4_9ACTN|nr:DUF6177 family protein [Actinomadura syzygii]TYC18459.1 hypothetical protein FXF65_01465 [Actinomadura syzygii]
MSDQAASPSAGGADARTDEAEVFLVDRQPVALSPSLSEAARECAASGRKPQIVTCYETRLTVPMRELTGGGAEWIVRADGGYYDGNTGRPLHWNGSAFVPVPDAQDYAPGYKRRPDEPLGTHLTLVLRAPHPANGPLGGIVEDLMHMLTGEAPAGWGPAEPAQHLWSCVDLGAFVRGQRGLTPPVVSVGAGMFPAIAFTEYAQSRDGGHNELTTLVLGCPPGEPPPVKELPALIGEIASRHPLVSLLAHVRPGRADLTVGPQWAGPSMPVALAVRGDPPGLNGVPAARIGPPQAPVTWFSLSSGNPRDDWRNYHRLLQQLGQRR